MNPKVDAYLTNCKSWKSEMKLLREIVLSSELIEEFKWGKPCYMFEQNNVLSIAPMKESCALAFFKGALLKDDKKILLKPGENTRAGRWIKFTSLNEIKKLEKILKEYIVEAIEIEKAGLRVIVEDNAVPELPVELQTILKENKKFSNAFYTLTPGRQRGYVMFFSAPKQSSTRITRIEKYRQRILDGKGINDCTCGLSKKMPACDGSHKYKLA